MQNLVAGANAPLGAADAEVTIRWSPEVIQGSEVDVSAFLLTATGRVRGDHDFIFYNQPEGAAGAIHLSGSANTRTFRVRTGALPADIEKIAFAATLHGQARFADAREITITVSQTATFTPETSGRGEKALILGELYKRNGLWKFRAVGQGFNGGLGPLATSFGVDVQDEPVKPPAPATPPPPPAPVPPAPSAPPGVRLTKITLEKRGDSQTISLEKGHAHQEIVINLNWTSRGGFFSQSIDLDLGVFWEMKTGEKSIIDGLQFAHGQGGPRHRLSRQGCYTEPPYVWHTGDDLSGSSSDGENILVNPAGFAALKRLVVYCFIYDGAPRWNKTNAVVTVKVPGQPEIVVEMGNQNSNLLTCAICSIDFLNATQMKVTKHVTFHDNLAEADRAYGWGLSYRAGTK